MDVEQRLTRLEQLLGVDVSTDVAKIESRLTHAESRMFKKNNDVFSWSMLDNQLKECHDLEQELIHFDSADGLLLSSSSTTATTTTTTTTSKLDKPLLYKRMELLAQKETLEQNLKQILRMKEYLLLDHPLNKQQQSKQTNIPSQVVTEAPILTKYYHQINDPSMETRIKDAQTKVQKILLESTNIASRIDTIVDQHYQIIHEINEKIETRLSTTVKN